MRWFYGHGLGLFMIPRILFWIVIIAVIVYLVKNHKQTQPTGEQGKASMDILKERYARGEISDEDFERMKTKLETK